MSKGYTTVSLQGSSRSSKTYNALIWLLVYAMQHPKTRVSVVRATLPSIKGSVFVDFKEILVRMGLFNERSLNKSDFIYTLANGSWFEFFSTDSEQKLRGRKRDVLFVNEANELRFIEWQQLKMRTTRFAIIDYNPSFNEEHWINGVNADPRTYHFISTYRDNPFLEQTIIDEIESLREKNRSLWEVYGMGVQSQIEGLVFKDTTLCESIPDHIKRRYIGVDYGFTNDPTAIVLVAVEGDSLYVEEVAYSTSMLTSDIIEVLKRPQYRAIKVISESADPRLVEEIYRAGINIHPVRKYAGSVEAGIAKMLELKIHITRQSANVQKEFKSYTYQQDKNGRWLNVPVDMFNHAIDSIRYVCMEEIMGGQRKPIDTDRLGRLVY